MSVEKKTTMWRETYCQTCAGVRAVKFAAGIPSLDVERMMFAGCERGVGFMAGRVADHGCGMWVLMAGQWPTRQRYDFGAWSTRKETHEWFVLSIAMHARIETGSTHCLVVAMVDGRPMSIYDGRTEYAINQTVMDPLGEDHAGGYALFAFAACLICVDNRRYYVP
eukprot:gene3621-4553_t